MPNANEPPKKTSTELSAAHCPAYILCGGQSARFGTDKARLRIDLEPQLVRLAKSLRGQGHETHFVADRADRFQDLGIVSIADALPAYGPMAGLVAAAAHRSTHGGAGWLLLTSCDQLRWQPKYFQGLADHALNERLAITYGDPLFQPIPGLYHTRIQSFAALSLSLRQLSLKRLLESFGEAAQAIEVQENPREWCFNSQLELDELLSKLALESEP